MATSGILEEDLRVELLEGMVVEMTPIGDRHASMVDRAAEFFMKRVPASVTVRVQGPVRISDLSQFQPDLLLLRRRDDYYGSGTPRAADVLLAVEVADSSLDIDRGVKARLYAAAGVAELWVVDVKAGAVESYRVPSPQGYQEVGRVGRGEDLAPIAFPDDPVPVEAIVGP